jgi:hypothetical protein
MIRDLQVSNDAAGFPIVAWTEDRNLASPEAMIPLPELIESESLR